MRSVSKTSTVAHNWARQIDDFSSDIYNWAKQKRAAQRKTKQYILLEDDSNRLNLIHNLKISNMYIGTTIYA